MDSVNMATEYPKKMFIALAMPPQYFLGISKWANGIAEVMVLKEFGPTHARMVVVKLPLVDLEQSYQKSQIFSTKEEAARYMMQKMKEYLRFTNFLQEYGRMVRIASGKEDSLG
jgi:hypothetical protein